MTPLQAGALEQLCAPPGRKAVPIRTSQTRCLHRAHSPYLAHICLTSGSHRMRTAATDVPVNDECGRFWWCMVVFGSGAAC
jgi:hypothetical protein